MSLFDYAGQLPARTGFRGTLDAESAEDAERILATTASLGGASILAPASGIPWERRRRAHLRRHLPTATRGWRPRGSRLGRTWMCPMRTVAIATLAVVALVSPACTATRWALPPAQVPLRPEYVGRLRVLHVSHELGRGAGYPIKPNMVVTSVHANAERTRAVGVEGAPMMAGNLIERMSIDREQMAPRDDWIVLLTSVERFTPNLVDPDVTLRPGEPVLLGGFMLAGRKYTQREYWRIPPIVIEGEFVEPEDRAEHQAGLVLVRVPAGNYAGFSGGPAARVDAAGRLHVFGTIVHQGYVKNGKSFDKVLGIARLPKNINEQWRWRSY